VCERFRKIALSYVGKQEVIGYFLFVTREQSLVPYWPTLSSTQMLPETSDKVSTSLSWVIENST